MHDNDVKSVSLDLDDINNTNSKDDITFSIDTVEEPPKIIDLEPTKNEPSNNKSANVDVGLDLLANPKKQMRPESPNDDVVKLNNSDKKDDLDLDLNLNKINDIKIDDIKVDEIKDDNINKVNDIKVDDIKLSNSESNDNEIKELSINDLFGNNNIDTKIEDISISDIGLDIKTGDNDTNKETLLDSNINPISNSEILEDIEKKDFPRVKTFEEVQKEKREYLLKFDRLRGKGANLQHNFTMQSNVDDMKNEFERVTYNKKVENSVKMQRQWLLAFSTGLEMLNKKFDPFDIKLDGWSESISENVTDYDEVFEELYEKYKEKAEVAPELKLMLMVGGSAFMFHITNSMFKSSLPGMEQIMKQNPDLMKSFASAAMQQMGQQNPGVANFMDAYGPQGMQQNQEYVPNNIPPNDYNDMAFNQGTRNVDRPEMRGPSGVDSIIGNLGNDNFTKRNSMSTNSASDLSDIRNINLDVNKKKRKETSGITLDL